nr:uncharacterized protein LOC117275105 [Nicotiana tomentosiformis]
MCIAFAKSICCQDFAFVRPCLHSRDHARIRDEGSLTLPKETVLRRGSKELTSGDDDVLLQGLLYVPNVDGLMKNILEEAHISRYSIHPSATKMSRDQRQHYWWRRMKKGIFECVVRCLNCQQVKYEHQRPCGLL